MGDVTAILMGDPAVRWTRKPTQEEIERTRFAELRPAGNAKAKRVESALTPHLELEMTAKAAIEGRTAWRAAVVAAERTPFVKADGEGREFAHLQNSLKTLCQAWDERTEGAHRDCVKAAISATLSAIALWPVRVSAPPARPKRATCARDVPVPWYVARDL